MNENTRLIVSGDLPERIKSAASRLAEKHGIVVTEKVEGDFDQGIWLQISDEPIATGTKRDGYEMIVEEDQVRLTGNSESGLFYALMTLDQKLTLNQIEITGSQILDAPAFESRGFYHDISRGKVPTLETMKHIVDVLAAHKMNQFQLYVEHTFAFEFDPRIPHNPDALTADEVRELDQYCYDRYIDLVPSLQSFGHMSGLTSLPEYRALAEIENDKDWEQLSWHERMSGSTLDTTNPEARELMKRMLDEYLPLFRSNFVNVCADETYDVGKGKSKEYADSIGGPGRLYLEHINWLNEVCKSHNKKMMFWGDIVKKHPEMIPDIPKDTILLNWGYYYKTDFESSKLFSDAGLEFYVCPGTSGWNEIMNGFKNADLNIERYAEAGEKYGATGMLTTDWGDHGHYNLLAGSWYGIIKGANESWSTGALSSEEFDAAFSVQFFGDGKSNMMAQLKELAFQLDQFSSWRAFYAPLTDFKRIKPITDERAEEMISQSAKVVKELESLDGNGWATEQDIQEFIHMSKMMGLLGEKILISRQLENGDADKLSADRLEEFAAKTHQLHEEYKVLWRARNKESELRRISHEFQQLIFEVRSLARSL